MKDFSIVIPIYNEENLLESQTLRILSGVKKLNLPVKFEILLVENGSTDNTFEIARRLASKHKKIRKIHLSKPSYGQAFREGVKKAKYPYIYQFDIDFWDIKFIKKSLNLLEKHDFVIGSKNMNGASDHRSFFRKMVSKFMEKIIEARFNTKLTDTHGLKALKKSVIGGLINDLTCDNHFLDSELLLRAASFGYSFAELPVSLKELRESRFPFYLRFKEVIKEFSQLMLLNISGEKRNEFAVSPKMPRGVINYIINLLP